MRGVYTSVRTLRALVPFVRGRVLARLKLLVANVALTLEHVLRIEVTLPHIARHQLRLI